MKQVQYDRLVLALIAAGFNTTPKLQVELHRRDAKITQLRQTKDRKGGKRLLTATLTRLTHRRRIRYDSALRAWQLVADPALTYQKIPTMDELIEVHSKSIPKKIDKRILLL